MINNSLLHNVAITMTPPVSQHVMAATQMGACETQRWLMWCCGPVSRSLGDAGPRTRDSRPRPPSVCRLAVCPPDPGHQFVGIRAGLHPQTGHHGVWSPWFVPFPPIHIHSWCLQGPPGGCQQITKVWVILYCVLARTVCSQLILARPRLPLRRQTGFAKQQTPNTSRTNLEIGNDFIWAEWESVTSGGGAPGSHQTCDNGLPETKLLVNDLVVESFLLLPRYLNVCH